eukprot:TRINITY_DN18405_c0_g1_i1.p1 TRINITY_DN18405_c0_g1~~TRINITY_DN18405_c0_g1_i1.p1  ORF type:complete len:964 (+),score=159.38 TRINITY_DN18405_c0_g1_i1:52-2892(+)
MAALCVQHSCSDCVELHTHERPTWAPTPVQTITKRRRRLCLDTDSDEDVAKTVADGRGAATIVPLRDESVAEQRCAGSFVQLQKGTTVSAQFKGKLDLNLQQLCSGARQPQLMTISRPEIQSSVVEAANGSSSTLLITSCEATSEPQGVEASACGVAEQSEMVGEFGDLGCAEGDLQDDEGVDDVSLRDAEAGSFEGSIEESSPRRADAVSQLVAMGFPKDSAVAALAATDWDLGSAAEVLACDNEDGESNFQRGVKRARNETSRPAASPRAAPVSVKRLPREKPKSPLADISRTCKETVIHALAGPGSKRTSKVENSIRRGRVSLRENLWSGDSHEDVLTKLAPSYGKLKEYQRTAVRWLLSLQKAGYGGILADEMGLGKTAVVLTFLDLHEKLRSKSRPNVCPSLVILPATLLDNWEAEGRRWCPHLSVFKYYASSADERMMLAEEFFAERRLHCRLVLTTAGVLHNKGDRHHFFRRINWRHLICDEAHGVKNAGTARFKDIDNLRVGDRILITGTPVQNSLRELANLLTLLLRSPSSEEADLDYQPTSRRKLSRGKAIDELDVLVERGSLRTLQVMAAPFILRRLKRDVMSELPPKVGRTVHCVFTPAQRAMYESELRRATEEAQQSKRGAGVRRNFVKSLFHRLRRLCGHPLLSQTRFSKADYERVAELLRRVRPDFANARPERALAEVMSWSDFELMQALRDANLVPRLGAGFDPRRFTITDSDVVEGSAKVAELLRILREQKALRRKTLVFSQFTQFLDVIVVALQTTGIPFAFLDGSVRVEARAGIVETFQSEDSGVDVFLLSTKAGGVGLNLVAADAVVLMDLSFNPQDNRQAEDRVHRLGQIRPVTVHYLVCKDTIEETVVKMNLNKIALDYHFGGQRSLLEDTTGGVTEDAKGGADAEKAEEADCDEEDDAAASKAAEVEVLLALEQSLGLGSAGG